MGGTTTIAVKDDTAKVLAQIKLDKDFDSIDAVIKWLMEKASIAKEVKTR